MGWEHFCWEQSIEFVVERLLLSFGDAIKDVLGFSDSANSSWRELKCRDCSFETFSKSSKNETDSSGASSVWEMNLSKLGISFEI